MVFPVVIWMWALDHKEGWEPKNWCFWMVALEKILESPLDCKEIKPVNLKGNKPWIFTEGLILKLKCQHFDHLMWRESSFARPWCWKGLRAGGEGSNGGWDGWMASLTQRTWVWANPRRWWRTENPGVLQSIGLQSQMWLRDWTAIITAVLFALHCATYFYYYSVVKDWFSFACFY